MTVDPFGLRQRRQGSGGHFCRRLRQRDRQGQGGRRGSRVKRELLLLLMIMTLLRRRIMMILYLLLLLLLVVMMRIMRGRRAGHHHHVIRRRHGRHHDRRGGLLRRRRANHHGSGRMMHVRGRRRRRNSGVLVLLVRIVRLRVIVMLVRELVGNRGRVVRHGGRQQSVVGANKPRNGERVSVEHRVIRFWVLGRERRRPLRPCVPSVVAPLVVRFGQTGCTRVAPRWAGSRPRHVNWSESNMM